MQSKKRFTKESELRNRAKNFAVEILKLCDSIDGRKGRSVLINQITRSATSIGANIHEANYAASKADFVNKLQIALKECFETEYWIDLMFSAGCFMKKRKKLYSTERNQTNEA